MKAVGIFDDFINKITGNIKPTPAGILHTCDNKVLANFFFQHINTPFIYLARRWFDQGKIPEPESSFPIALPDGMLVLLKTTGHSP